MLVMTAVLFVAWSWIENHLLSLDRAAWPKQYQSESMVYASPAILPRLGFWIAGAFPVAAAALGWQLRARASSVGADAGNRAARAVAVLAAVSGVLVALGAWVVLGGPVKDGDHDSARMVTTWTAVATLGAAVSVVAWGAAGVRASLTRPLMIGVSVGCVLFWLGALMAREAARWSTAGSPGLITRHESVGTLAGFVIFLTFAVVGLGAIGWVIARVSRTVAVGSR
jgi:hypothetical protein